MNVKVILPNGKTAHVTEQTLTTDDNLTGLEHATAFSLALGAFQDQADAQKFERTAWW